MPIVNGVEFYAFGNKALFHTHRGDRLPAPRREYTAQVLRYE
jgi:hypothetical protein